MNICLLNFILFICYILSNSNVDAINMRKLQNNFLRIYVFSSPKNVRKGLKNIQHIAFKTSDVINICIIEANTNYYALSEDERTLIETVISLAL